MGSIDVIKEKKLNESSATNANNQSHSTNVMEDLENISFKLFEILTNKDSATEASLDYGSAQMGRNTRNSMTKVQNISLQKPPTSLKSTKKKLAVKGKEHSKIPMPNYGNKSRSRVG